MSIDLEKNKSEILRAYDDVLSDKTPTDWILLGYEGQTNILKLIGTGDGGLEELADELNSSKVMYAVVRVTDPKTTRTKHVLINYIGEACPNLRKGICARHLHDVKGLLKGIHVTINARNEEEVEADQVFAALAKATATSYNFSDRSENEERNAPVGTNYQRTNPLSEINTSSRNKFWEEQEHEEQVRKQEEIQRKKLEEMTIDQERRKTEMKSSKEREVQQQEHSVKVAASRRASEVADERLRAAREPGDGPTAADAERDEQERARRAELLRKQRKQEAESVIGGSTKSARSVFESQGAAVANGVGNARAPARKLKEFTPLNNTSDSGHHNSNNISSNSNSRGAVARAWPPPSNSSGVAVQEERKPRQPMFVDSDVHASREGIVSSATARPNPIGASQSSPPASRRVPSNNVHKNEQRFTPSLYDGEDNLYEGEETQAPQLPPKSTYGAVTYEDEPPRLPKSQPPNTAPASYAGQMSSSNYYEDSEPVSASSHSTYMSNQTLLKKEDKLPTYAYVSEPPRGDRNSGARSMSGAAAPENFYEDDSEFTDHQNQQKLGGFTENSNRSYYAASNGPTQHRYDSVPVEPDDRIYDQPVEDYDLSVPRTVTGQGVEYQLLPEHGLCARALYDYQASDNTEISFDPSEIISNIEQIDEGWWQGVSPSGNFGLFPANYVELINAAAPRNS
ncbi:drebrin-like protein A isoform X2 [Hyalella azteca]|uniref:Coactosin-like protein n=1 Tax=Hyalella azteca TaxID=294128 RepID=A0A8B7PMX4_HYAAZ|nr:drebrin-like protein A isoform X2 [Hyalella azteca]